LTNEIKKLFPISLIYHPHPDAVYVSLSCLRHSRDTDIHSRRARQKMNIHEDVHAQRNSI
jgi:hypothetical protein